MRLAIPVWLFLAVLVLLSGHPAFADGRDGAVTFGDITILHARSNATPPGAPGVGYMVIMNRGSQADRLVAVRANFTEASLHQTTVKDGVARMVPLKKGVEIPAGGRVAFQPKGRHIMLMALDSPLQQGERRTLTLVFESAGEIDVPFLVKDVGEPMQYDHQHEN